MSSNTYNSIQSILIESLKNALNADKNLKNINIFTSVPNYAKTPYIKIGNIKNNTQKLWNDKSFSGEFEFSIFNKDKNNSLVMQVINYLSVSFPSFCIGKNINNISIVNVIPLLSNLTENTALRSWNGIVNLMIIANHT